MNQEEIRSWTIGALPALTGAAITVDEIARGGSDRRYFRVQAPGQSLIFCQNGTERVENESFAPLTDFLGRHGIAVPRILARDDAHRRLWIEDLGDSDLWSYRHSDWSSVRRPLYEDALREAARIHALNGGAWEDAPNLQPPFDAAMYQWEQDYFFDNFALNFSTATEAEIADIRQSPTLRGLRDELAALPRTLIHRDLQSQNVLVLGGRPAFIDYQGMRFGRPEYDLAALIFDPYVEMKPEEREDLIAFSESLSEEPDFRRRLFQCGASRLMQALGAYGFLGLVKKKPHFLEHIPAAVSRLRIVAVESDVLPELEPVLHLKEDR